MPKLFLTIGAAAVTIGILQEPVHSGLLLSGSVSLVGAVLMMRR